MHRHLMALLAGAFLALALVGCGGPAPADQAEPETPAEASADEATAEAETEAAAETTEEPEAPAEGEAPGTLVDTQRVGDINVGFVNIPADYVTFHDAAGGTDLQYSDPSGTSIFTLNTFDMDSVPEDQREGFDARAAAEAVWSNIESAGAQNVEGAIVEMAGVESYQVYGTYEDGTYLVCWLIGAPDGSIRYLAVEGPEDTIFDNVAMAEASYGFTA